MSPSTDATSSEPPCFQPAGALSDAVTVIAAGLSPIGYRPTVYQLITAIFALVDGSDAEGAAGVRHDVVVLGGQRLRAGRHGEGERVHLDQVAPPVELRAVGEDVQAR